MGTYTDPLKPSEVACTQCGAPVSKVDWGEEVITVEEALKRNPGGSIWCGKCTLDQWEVAKAMAWAFGYDETRDP